MGSSHVRWEQIGSNDSRSKDSITSLIGCLAGEVGFPACFMVLSDGMKTQSLIQALKNVLSSDVKSSAHSEEG